jgi:hypothetical protein
LPGDLLPPAPRRAGDPGRRLVRVVRRTRPRADADLPRDVANRGRDGSAEVIAAAADAIVTAIFAVRDEVRELRRELERRG